MGRYGARGTDVRVRRCRGGVEVGPWRVGRRVGGDTRVVLQRALQEAANRPSGAAAEGMRKIRRIPDRHPVEKEEEEEVEQEDRVWRGCRAQRGVSFAFKSAAHKARVRSSGRHSGVTVSKARHCRTAGFAFGLQVEKPRNLMRTDERLIRKLPLDFRVCPARRIPSQSTWDPLLPRRRAELDIFWSSSSSPSCHRPLTQR